MTTPDQALAELNALANPAKVTEMAAYHKTARPYLGVSNPQIDALYKEWRKTTDISERVAIAAALWDSNIHEARIAAAKLLTQARINPDSTVWNEILRWVPSFDAWAVADHACGAGARRLMAEPSRLDQVEVWTTDENKWVRRAAMVMTLPWTKQNYPTPADELARDRILGWAAAYTLESDWFIQKSVAWWLRSLSKHDKPRVERFLADHGGNLKSFAYKEANKYLS